jgi:hypothetical protein
VLPDEVAPIEEIRERRRRIFKRKDAAVQARKLVHIKINVDGPIAIAVFGDIHIDNPGCNFPLLEEHTALVKRTDGMFAACVGDLQDAWVGRLARLWANQGVTAREAWKLVHWWLDELADKLLWVTEGNHDTWAFGVNSVSLVDWIVSKNGGVTDTDALRLSMDLPGGHSIVVNCRHDFRGKSQYNAAHGMTKAALMGWRDDVLVAGHTHQFGYNPVKDPMTGRVSHPVRVASYKVHDEYAKERGLPDENITECFVIMCDPAEEDERHRVWIEFNPFRAARILKHLRADWAKRARRDARHP